MKGWQRIRAVSGEIDKLTKPDDPIYDFSNQPAFYFFANRPNPTRFYQVPIASPPEYQAEIIRDLERQKPKVVIRTAPEGFDEFDGIPNAIRAQAVAAYLDDCYRFYRSERGVELWTRLPNARPATLATYLKKFRIPAQKDVVTAERQRMVFPLVGSVAGANGTFWVSDLILHNALREPVSVSLRYISGDVRLDRHLEIAPRQTVTWPDVVRSFFGLPGGIGALWIEYRVRARADRRGQDCRRRTRWPRLAGDTAVERRRRDRRWRPRRADHRRHSVGDRARTAPQHRRREYRDDSGHLPHHGAQPRWCDHRQVCGIGYGRRRDLVRPRCGEGARRADRRDHDDPPDRNRRQRRGLRQRRRPERRYSVHRRDSGTAGP